MPSRLIKIAPWEDYVLRMIGVFKLIKAMISIALGIGLLHMLHKNLSGILISYVINPFHFDPESRFWAWVLEESTRVTPHGLRLISYGAFFYAAIFATEGIGLYLKKHWAEYMVLVSTSCLLPVEFYEIYLQVQWWKVVVVVTNLAILLYLMHRLWLDSWLKARNEEASTRSKRLSGRSGNRPAHAVKTR